MAYPLYSFRHGQQNGNGSNRGVTEANQRFLLNKHRSKIVNARLGSANIR